MAYRISQINPWLDEECAQAVADTIRDGWITEGPRTQAFASRLNALIGTPFGVFAPNGTLALALGLMAMNIGPGDEVLVPDTTFFGSASAVTMVGATPIFVDVDPRNFQIDVDQATRWLTPRTKALMPVHLFGTACDMGAVCAFAERHGLGIIEDAAQGIGVSWEGRHVGSFGDIGCFSFFADKTITTGEGGYIACRDEAVYRRLCLLRNQGRIDRGSFIHPAIGFNFRLTDMQSALGLAQLDRLPKIIARKQELLRRYQDKLAVVPQVRVLDAASGANIVPFRCVIMAEQARALMAYLEQDGIQSRSFFHPMHRQPGLREWGAGRIPEDNFDDSHYPNANFGWDHGICLPIFPTLTDADVDSICDCIARFYQTEGTGEGS